MEESTEILIPKAENAEGAVAELAWNRPWLLARRVEADEESQTPYELIWRTRDNQTTIHYVEDPVVKFPYVVIKGPDAASIAMDFRSSLEVYDQDELFEWFANAEAADERSRALARLAVVAPKSHAPRFLEAFNRAFSDDSRMVRHTAIWTSAYPSWPELMTPLERLAETDPDKDIRQDARNMAESFRSQGVVGGVEEEIISDPRDPR